MSAINKEVLTSKTTLTAIASIIVSGVGVALGDVTAYGGLQTGLLGLVAIFLRAAVGGVAERADAATATAQAVQAVQAEQVAQEKREEVTRVDMPLAGES